MPDPKKQKKQTTAKKTARPTARTTTKTNDGKGVEKRGSGEWTNNPSVGRASIPVTRKGSADDAGSWGATYAYDFYDEDHQDRVEGRENKFKSLLASGGKAGTVGKYSSDGGRGDVGKRSYDGTRNRSTGGAVKSAQTSDPFLRGFNSDDHQTVQRPTRRRKRK